MVNVWLDGNGRLREFRGVPYDSPGEAVSLENVFRAAGFDFSTFTETTPASRPETPADQLRAWKAPHPKFPEAQITVEIATWRGQITAANFSGPWVLSDSQSANRFLRRLRDNLILIAAVAGIAIALLFASRNWRLNRVDRRGAVRLAAVSFLLSFVSWFGQVHAIRGSDWLSFFYYSAARWLMMAAVLALLYLALEPAIRARWPHSLVAWSRILAGNWRDPMVASHVLTGAATGTLLWAAFSIFNLMTIPANEMRAGGSLYPAQGLAAWAGAHAERLNIALLIGLVGFFVLFVLRALLKKDILAALVASLIFPFFEGDVVNRNDWLILALLYAIVFAALMFAMLRFGMLTAVSAAYFINTANYILTGSDWNTWYAPYSIATMCLVLAVSAFAFWRSLAGRDLRPDT
jgi:serine/threonine-protein kinase